LKIKDITNISPRYADFIEYSPTVRAFIPARPAWSHLTQRAVGTIFPAGSRQRLCRLLERRAESCRPGARVRENIRRLQNPGTAVILANLPADPLAGPAGLILKCLTAVKLGEKLHESGVEAVPLGWISDHDPDERPDRRLFMLNAGSRLCRLSPGPPEKGGAESAGAVPEEIRSLLSRIREIAGDSGDPEIMDILETACRPGRSGSSATACAFSRLTGDWGLLLLESRRPDWKRLQENVLSDLKIDPLRIEAILRRELDRLREAGYSADYRGQSAAMPDIVSSVLIMLAQNHLLPLAARVVDPPEMLTAGLMKPLADDSNSIPPLLWPQASATIIDARSRRALERHGIGFAELFAGARVAVDRMARWGKVASLLDNLDGLKSEIAGRTAELAALAAERADLAGDVEEARRRMSYQIDKLRQRLTAAAAEQRQAAERQLGRTANRLAPDGRLQERALAGIWFLLEYSRRFLDVVHRKVDIMNFDHQLIDMD
jgi:uncharacterized protein YllA (UPF0747 family)